MSFFDNFFWSFFLLGTKRLEMIFGSRNRKEHHWGEFKQDLMSVIYRATLQKSQSDLFIFQPSSIWFYELEVRMESKLSFLVRAVLDEVEFAFDGQLSKSGGLCWRTWWCCWNILVGVERPESLRDLLVLPRP